LWTVSPRRRLAVEQMHLKTPHVVDVQWTKRSYWQLALPSDEHLLGLPSAASAELTWKRRWPFWEKLSRLGQEDLERWTGASRQEPLPQSLNQYLFSSFDAMPEIRVVTAQRRTLLLFVSGLALLAGLLVMYSARCRHPVVLLVVGVALAAVMLIYPDLSMFAVQASALGLILALLAWLLKWAVEVRESKRMVLHGATLAGPDSKTVRVPMPRSDSNAFPASTTASAGSHAHLAEPNT
jgi:hypothetical protein